jgi:hypothetical protein
VADLLIRDVPEHVVAAIDGNARRLGLSRSEYLRRQVAAAAVGGGPVRVEDLARFSKTFADLADPEVMARAWE